jgi:ribose transport system permease protein
LALLVVFFSWRSPYFFQAENFINILQNVAVIGIVAAPATLLLVGGQLDLSVGSTAALTGAVAAVLAASPGITPLAQGWPLWAAILAAVICAMAVGAVNAFCVVKIGINPLITTLGTLAIVRGLTKVIADGQTVRIDDFETLGIKRVLGLPLPVYILVGVIVLFALLMRYTTFGRSMYAIGSSPRAARLAGIPTGRYIALAYLLSAACVAAAGLILLSQVGGASINGGLGLELAVITAVVLGGASLSGGRGRISGTVLAVLIVGVLGNGLIQLNVPSFWIEVAGGVLLLGAVAFDRLRSRMVRTSDD